MYCGVPIATPKSVIGSESGIPREASSALAIPKSETAAVSPESRMLSGLMSRCTIPLRVREIQRARDIPENADGDGDRHRAGAHEAHAERLPFHEGHRVVGQPFRLTGGEHRHDVRVLQPGGDQYLALEAVEIDAGGEIG